MLAVAAAALRALDFYAIFPFCLAVLLLFFHPVGFGCSSAARCLEENFIHSHSLAVRSVVRFARKCCCSRRGVHNLYNTHVASVCSEYRRIGTFWAWVCCVFEQQAAEGIFSGAELFDVLLLAQS